MPTKNRMQTSRPPIILAECSHDAVRRTPRVVVLSLPLLNTKTPYMPARKNHSTRRINGKNAQQNNGRHMPSQGERTEYMLSSTQPMKRCPKKKKKKKHKNKTRGYMGNTQVTTINRLLRREPMHPKLSHIHPRDPAPNAVYRTEHFPTDA